MPGYLPTMEDRLSEGWGLPDGPDDEEEAFRRKALRIAPSPAQISAHLAALEWPARYLVPEHAGSARILNIWVRCKAYDRPFKEAIERRPYIDRSIAYRMRDRALSVVSVCLDRDGVPL